MKTAYLLPHTSYPVSCCLFPELSLENQSIFLTQGRKDFTQSTQRGYDTKWSSTVSEIRNAVRGAMSAGDADAAVRWDSCRLDFFAYFFYQEKKYEEKKYLSKFYGY